MQPRVQEKISSSNTVSKHKTPFCSVFANYDLKILKEKKLKSIFNNQVCSRLIKGHLKLFLFLASSHEMPCFTGISAFNCIPLWVHER